MEKAILIGVDTKSNDIFPMEYQMEELKALADAAEIEVISYIIQKIDRPNPRYYIGTGKVEEIRMQIKTLDATMAIINDELSPSQIESLEDGLDCKVIDRSMLILDIFAKRAKTRTSMLEVELAQLKYLLPRLVGMNKSLSRQGGASGSFSAKGPGEKKIELDRRMIEGQIHHLEQELKKAKAHRTSARLQREKNQIPVVALVGYTNSGKSTTLNTLLSYSKAKNMPKKEVLSKDMLFATVDTHARNIVLPDNQEIILIDTVGFVSKIPNHLIQSFQSTLEEIRNADLILHVVDISQPFCDEQIEITNSVLKEIGIEGIPMFYLYNKADLIQESYGITHTPGCLFSNKKNINHSFLLQYIDKEVTTKTIYKEYTIPYENHSFVYEIQSLGNILQRLDLENKTVLKGYFSKKDISTIEALFQSK